MNIATSRLNWKLIRKVVGIVFLLLVAVLIYMQARKIEWSKVGEAVHNYRARTLALAALITVASYSVYSCFDLISRRCVHSHLSRAKTLSIAAISYVFNQNFGYFVGGMGFRFRLYSQSGLDDGQITRIIGLGVLTNWLGYSVLAGAMFALGKAPVPANWKIDVTDLRIAGCALLLAVIGYLAFALHRHRIALGKWSLELPQAHAIIGQLLLSIAHWSLTAAVIWTLLSHKLDYLTVLSTMLLASIAAVAMHIPAGLGVIEAVFFNVLGDRVPRNELLAALMAYRATFHLLPLCIGGIGFIGMEARAKREAQQLTP